MKKSLFGILIVVALFSSKAQENIFTDKRDGKTYKTITIGNKIWMIENLNFDMDNQGSYCYPQRMLNLEISEIEKALTFYHIDKKGVTGLKGIDLLIKFNPYLKKAIKKYPKGWRYYTYDAAKKVCPEGWRIPTNEDWNELNTFIKAGQSFKLNFDSLGYWKNNHNNPILEIRLGDYFGDSRAMTYWSASESPEIYCTADWHGTHFSLNPETKPRDNDSMNDLAFCIRCVKDVSK